MLPTTARTEHSSMGNVVSALVVGVVALLEFFKGSPNKNNLTNAQIKEYHKALDMNKKLEEEAAKARKEAEESAKRKEEAKKEEEKARQEEKEAREREVESRKRKEKAEADAAEAQRKAEESAKREAEAKKREEEVRQRENEAREREADSRKREEKAKLFAEQAEQARRDFERASEESAKREKEAEEKAKKAKQLADESKQATLDAQKRERETNDRMLETQKREAEARKDADEAQKREEQFQKDLKQAKFHLEKGIQPEVWPTEEEFQLANDRIEYDPEKLHFAVCGSSGSGKSSLVNAFRGLRNKGPQAARTGVVETTMLITRYPDPRKELPYNRFVWFDCPGAGTLEIPGWQYFNQQGLFVFDIIVLVYDGVIIFTTLAIYCQLICIIYHSSVSLRLISQSSGTASDSKFLFSLSVPKLTIISETLCEIWITTTQLMILTIIKYKPNNF